VEAPVVTASKPRSLLGNAGWSFVSTAWFAASSFILTPFLIAHLGTNHYGLFVLLASITGVLGVLDLGLGQATLRYVAHYYGRKDMAGINRTLGATFAVHVLTGSLAWALLFYGASWVAGWLAVAPQDLELTVDILLVMAISFGLTLVSGAFGAIPKALQRYDLDTAVQLGQSILQLLGTAAILLLGMGIYELVVWGLMTTLFRQILNMALAKHLIPELRLVPRPSREGLREVFGFGIYSAISQLLAVVWQESDRLLLGTLFSASAVGYLTLPKNLVTRGASALCSAGSALFPRFGATEDRHEIRRLLLDATWSMFSASIVLFVPITVLLPDFLRLWVGPEFAATSARVGQVLAFSFIFRGGFVPYQGLFQGLGKPQYLTVISLGSGLTILALNLLLIPAFGLVGAGYAYVLALAWGFSGLLYAWKVIKEQAPWSPLVRAALLPCALALVSLSSCLWIRTLAGEPRWLALVLLGVLFAGITSSLLVGADWLLARSESHAASLLRALARLLRSAPGYRLVASHIEGRF